MCVCVRAYLFLQRFLVVHEERDGQLAQAFVDATMQQLRKDGLSQLVAAPRLHAIKVQKGPIEPSKQWQRQLQAVVDEFKPQLLTAVINDRVPGLYTAIKECAVVQSGVPSQVVTTKTLSNEKRFAAICTNILRQMLTKCGGAPWRVSVCCVCVCVVSAHVCAVPPAFNFFFFFFFFLFFFFFFLRVYKILPSTGKTVY